MPIRLCPSMEMMILMFHKRIFEALQNKSEGEEFVYKGLDILIQKQGMMNVI